VVPGRVDRGLFLRGAFVAIALILVVFGDARVTTFSVIFVSIVLEAFPFMLLGSMISGIIEVYVSKDRLAELLPKRRIVTTVIAACAGLVFPVCECAIVPVVRRFLRKGIPLSAAIAYLLAGPIFNPVVGVSTAVAYAPGSTSVAWAVVGIRLGCGFLVAVVVGTIVGRVGAAAAVEDEPEPSPCGCGHDHGTIDGQRRFLSALRHGADEFLDVGQYLVIGAFVAAMAQTVLSRQAFIDLAASPVAAIGLMMTMAVVLNLCSEADAFVAASFRAYLPLTSQMSFMVLGPMLDLKLIAMYLGVFRKRAIVVIAVLVLLSVFCLMGVLHALGADAAFAAHGIGPEVTP
jgi:uncharacterized membrane protein YraQ (UPF0718 family)